MRQPLFFPFFAAITCAGLLLAHGSRANNIQVTNPTLTGNTGTSALVQFDLSWENSWRGGGVNNWDAAWVFVKYRTIGGVWQHVLLNNTGHTAPVGSMIDLGLLIPGGTPWDANTNPAIGTFIRRSADGNGTFALTGVQLRWNYGTQGLAYNDITQVQVFAIEMAAVLQGAFAAGSGGTENAHFTLTTINTSNPTVSPSGTGSLGGQAGGYPSGQTAPNILWPNGFNAFYCMKYEVTQQGYVDFLNTLNYSQQATRTTTDPGSIAGTGALVIGNTSRNGIDIQTPGIFTATPAVYACNMDGDANFGESNDGKDIACHSLSWADLATYLDWSGLRPMTELEFEKSCRGTMMPVADEYAWGSNGAASLSYQFVNPGSNNETITTNYSSNMGNVSYSFTVNPGISGPLRVGIFAANAGNSGRISSGATYYGIMEMSGNVNEQPVTIANVEGRVFTGTHGDGHLVASGNADVATWPTTSGVGIRGSSWAQAGTLYIRVSDRTDASSPSSGRFSYVGGRGVRSAP